MKVPRELVRHAEHVEVWELLTLQFLTGSAPAQVDLTRAGARKRGRCAEIIVWQD